MTIHCIGTYTHHFVCLSCYYRIPIMSKTGLNRTVNRERRAGLHHSLFAAFLFISPVFTSKQGHAFLPEKIMLVSVSFQRHIDLILFMKRRKRHQFSPLCRRKNPRNSRKFLSICCWDLQEQFTNSFV